MADVLIALGARTPLRWPAAPTPPSQVGYRWLKQRLALGGAGASPMLLASDPVRAEAPLRGNEYQKCVRRLRRWFPLILTDTPRAPVAPVLPAVVDTADWFVVVGGADEAGVAAVQQTLYWLRWLRQDQGAGGRVTCVLIQRGEEQAGRFQVSKNFFQEPTFVLPRDHGAGRSDTLVWHLAGPNLKRAIFSVAASVIKGLANSRSDLQNSQRSI